MPYQTTLNEFRCLLDLYVECTRCSGLSGPNVKKLYAASSEAEIAIVWGEIKPNCSKFGCFYRAFCKVKNLARQHRNNAASSPPKTILGKRFQKLQEPYTLLPGGCLRAVQDFIYVGTRSITENKTKLAADAHLVLRAFRALVACHVSENVEIKYNKEDIRERIAVYTSDGSCVGKEEKTEIAAFFRKYRAFLPYKCTRCTNCRNFPQAPVSQLKYDIGSDDVGAASSLENKASVLGQILQQAKPVAEQSWVDAFYAAMKQKGIMLPRNLQTEQDPPRCLKQGLYLCRLKAYRYENESVQEKSTQDSSYILFLWHVNYKQINQVILAAADNVSYTYKDVLEPKNSSPLDRYYNSTSYLRTNWDRGSWWSRERTEEFLNEIAAALKAQKTDLQGKGTTKASHVWLQYIDPRSSRATQLRRNQGIKVDFKILKSL